MFNIKLVVDDYERWLTGLHYEYFCPVQMKEDFYTKFLYKNFPFEISDSFDLLPYHKHVLPTIKPSFKDEKLQQEAYKRSSDSQAFASRSRASISEVQKTPKGIYYNELVLRRQAAGLDYGIAPNYNYKYDNYLRPEQDICAKTEFNKVGGIFNLRLESSSNDDFLYEWMISGQMKNGRIVFYDGDGDQAFKIEFWDCYCVGIAEQMNSIGNSAMTMNLRLSPAITRNRSVEHQKVWKVTDISRNNRAFGGGPVAPAEAKVIESFDEIYLLDESGQKVVEIDEPQNVTLVIKTRGKIGKKISSIDLTHEEYSFLYNGNEIDKGALANYEITIDEEHIPLEVIEQEPHSN